MEDCHPIGSIQTLADPFSEASTDATIEISTMTATISETLARSSRVGSWIFNGCDHPFLKSGIDRQFWGR
jgi:hypothetical protein